MPISMTPREERATLSWRKIPHPKYDAVRPRLCHDATLTFATAAAGCKFASVSVADPKLHHDFMPTPSQFLKHPLAVFALVPRDAALFSAGAIAGAGAKTVTAPLDRIKLLMQTHGVRVGQDSAKKAMSFIEAIAIIGKEEGIQGYWKGNLPQVCTIRKECIGISVFISHNIDQSFICVSVSFLIFQVIRVVPYSAVQLFAYEIYKKIFRGQNGELSVVGRLAAGAFAGMTSTFITYPLDVLRLRLAVEPGCRTMSEVALSMLREEGFASFYSGLGPSLIAIAPYIAMNFCVLTY
ncbi:Thylakoid ADP,ATP carrier protein [Spatholobus suberectus]|nr:Thylakoid ADP,ATP carrier protein [Spatholobus suberectus]